MVVLSEPAHKFVVYLVSSFTSCKPLQITCKPFLIAYPGRMYLVYVNTSIQQFARGVVVTSVVYGVVHGTWNIMQRAS